MLNVVAGADIDSLMVIQNSSDLELIQAVLAGNREMFAPLVERHKAMLFSLIMRQVRNSIVAEELCQESFIKAYLGLKNFRSESLFSTWLIRIGLNQVNSYFSSARFRQQQVHETFEVSKHELSNDDQDNQLQKERKYLLFSSALSNLKPKLRDVIVLCGLEGKSYEEAAQILEIPIGTVRSRLNSARLALKNSIASDFFSGNQHES